MKKAIIIFTLIFFSTYVHSQTFMGIEITGNQNKIKVLLEEKGFITNNQLTKKDNIYYNGKKLNEEVTL